MAEIKFINPSLVNTGVDLGSIERAAKNSSGIDLQPALGALSEYAHKKMLTKQNMEIDNVKSEYDREMNKYNILLSDPNLYKDKTKLDETLKEFDKFYSSSKGKLAELTISDERMNTLKNDFDDMKKSLDNKVKYNKQQQEINEALQAEHKDIAERSNRILSNSYSGRIEFIDKDYRTIEDKLNGLVSRGLVDKNEADDYLANLGARATVIGKTNNDVSQIMNSNLSIREKNDALNQLKQDYYKDEFIKELSKESSKDTTTSKETMEMGIRNQLGQAENIINMAINSINYKNKNKTASVDDLSQEDKDQYKEMLFDGKIYEAQEYLAEKTKTDFSFAKRDDFYNNEQVQQDFYGYKFNLSDPQDLTIPKNTLPEEARNSIQNILFDPMQYLGLTEQQYKNMSDYDLSKLSYRRILDVVKEYMGTDNDVVAVKYLVGADLTLPNKKTTNQLYGEAFYLGMDLSSLSFGYAMLNENNKLAANRMVSEAKLRINQPSISNAYLSIYNMPNSTDKQKQDRKEALSIVKQQMILPKTVVEGDTNIIPKAGIFFKSEKYFKPTQDGFNTMVNVLDKISDEVGLTEIKQAELQSEIASQIATSESLQLLLFDYALYFFNKDHKKETQYYEKGVSMDQLLEVKDTKTNKTAFEKAFDLYLRQQLGKDTLNSIGKVGATYIPKRG